MPYLCERLCNFEECGVVTVGRSSLCPMCMVVRCVDHRGARHHQCAGLNFGKDTKECRIISGRAERDDWSAVFECIDRDLIIRQAEAMIPGHLVVFDMPATAEWRLMRPYWNMYSANNLHFPLTFGDDDKWLVRIRRKRKDDPPVGLLRSVIQSEVATMNALHEAGLLVPRAELPLGFGEPATRWDMYFFVQRLSGSPWSPSPSSSPDHIISTQMRTFIYSYARQQISISQAPFSAIGSLYPGPNGTTTKYQVGPMVSLDDAGRSQPPYFFGPFKTNRDRYLTWIDLNLDLVAKHHNWDNDPELAYLMFLEARYLVAGDIEMARVETETYIKHMDDIAEQFLVDAADDLTGIIDWEWAIVTTKAEAFAAPIMLSEDSAYDKGSNELTLEEHVLIAAYIASNRHDLANCVRAGRRYQRLLSLFRSLLLPDVHAMNGLRQAFEGDASYDLPDTIEGWKSRALDRYAADASLATFLSERMLGRRSGESVRTSIEEGNLGVPKSSAN